MTVVVELGSHFIDTMNMQSKILESQESFYDKKPKAKAQNVAKSGLWEQKPASHRSVMMAASTRRAFILDKMRGYQLVVHGYFFTSIIFFLVQFKGKLLISSLINDDSGK